MGETVKARNTAGIAAMVGPRYGTNSVRPAKSANTNAYSIFPVITSTVVKAT